MIIRTSPGQCHVSSVPVFNSMRQPEVKTWGGVVTAAMVIALVVYMGTGECSHSLQSPRFEVQLS